MAKIWAFFLPMGVTLFIIFGGTTCGCGGDMTDDGGNVETTIQTIGVMIDILDQPSIINPLGGMFLALVVFKAVRFKRDMRRRRIRKDREFRELKKKLEYEYAMRK